MLKHEQKLLHHSIGNGFSATRNYGFYSSFFSHCRAYEVLTRSSFQKLPRHTTEVMCSRPKKLGEIVARYATVVHDDGTIVCDWRNILTKYSKLPGIRTLHDFIFTKNPVTRAVIAKVCSQCYEGRFTDSDINIARDREINENVIMNKFIESDENEPQNIRDRKIIIHATLETSAQHKEMLSCECGPIFT